MSVSVEFESFPFAVDFLGQPAVSQETWPFHKKNLTENSPSRQKKESMKSLHKNVITKKLRV